MVECDIWLKNSVITVGSSAEKSENSLEDWLKEVVKHHVGIKLNIKENTAIQPALTIIEKLKDKIGSQRPLWLAAAVALGPGATSSVPIISKDFFLHTKNMFPDATISVSWHTSWSTKLSEEEKYYSWNNIWEMLQVIDSIDIQQPINFEFHAPFVHHSIPQMKFLLDVLKKSSISIWDDSYSVSLMEFLYLRKQFNHQLIFYDISLDMADDFSIKKDIPDYLFKPPDSEFLMSSLWTVETGDFRTFIGTETMIIPTKGTILKSKQKYQIANNSSLIAEGKIYVIGHSDVSIMKIQFNNLHMANTNPFYECFVTTDHTTGCQKVVTKSLNATNAGNNTCIFYHFSAESNPSGVNIQSKANYSACHNPRDELTNLAYDIMDVKTELNGIFDCSYLTILLQPDDGYFVFERFEIIAKQASCASTSDIKTTTPEIQETDFTHQRDRPFIVNNSNDSIKTTVDDTGTTITSVLSDKIHDSDNSIPMINGKTKLISYIPIGNFSNILKFTDSNNSIIASISNYSPNTINNTNSSLDQPSSTVPDDFPISSINIVNIINPTISFYSMSHSPSIFNLDKISNDTPRVTDVNTELTDSFTPSIALGIVLDDEGKRITVTEALLTASLVTNSLISNYSYSQYNSDVTTELDLSSPTLTPFTASVSNMQAASDYYTDYAGTTIKSINSNLTIVINSTSNPTIVLLSDSSNSANEHVDIINNNNSGTSIDNAIITESIVDPTLILIPVLLTTPDANFDTVVNNADPITYSTTTIIDSVVDTNLILSHALLSTEDTNFNNDNKNVSFINDTTTSVTNFLRDHNSTASLSSANETFTTINDNSDMITDNTITIDPAIDSTSTLFHASLITPDAIFGPVENNADAIADNLSILIDSTRDPPEISFPASSNASDETFGIIIVNDTVTDNIISIIDYTNDPTSILFSASSNAADSAFGIVNFNANTVTDNVTPIIDSTNDSTSISFSILLSTTNVTLGSIHNTNDGIAIDNRIIIDSIVNSTLISSPDASDATFTTISNNDGAIIDNITTMINSTSSYISIPDSNPTFGIASTITENITPITDLTNELTSISLHASLSAEDQTFDTIKNNYVNIDYNTTTINDTNPYFFIPSINVTHITTDSLQSSESINTDSKTILRNDSITFDSRPISLNNFFNITLSKLGSLKNVDTTDSKTVSNINLTNEATTSLSTPFNLSHIIKKYVINTNNSESSNILAASLLPSILFSNENWSLISRTTLPLANFIPLRNSLDIIKDSNTIDPISILPASSLIITPITTESFESNGYMIIGSYMPTNTESPVDFTSTHPENTISLYHAETDNNHHIIKNPIESNNIASLIDVSPVLIDTFLPPNTLANGLDDGIDLIVTNSLLNSTPLTVMSASTNHLNTIIYSDAITNSNLNHGSVAVSVSFSNNVDLKNTDSESVAEVNVVLSASFVPAMTLETLHKISVITNTLLVAPTLKNSATFTKFSYKISDSNNLPDTKPIPILFNIIKHPINNTKFDAILLGSEMPSITVVKHINIVQSVGDASFKTTTLASPKANSIYFETVTSKKDQSDSVLKKYTSVAKNSHIMNSQKGTLSVDKSVQQIAKVTKTNGKNRSIKISVYILTYLLIELFILHI